MVKNRFLSVCRKVFKFYGFTAKGNNFHFDFENDFYLVFGLQKSSYGEYFYINPAMYIGSINEDMPFPPFSFCEIRLPRLMCNFSQEFKYEELGEEDLSLVLKESIEKLLKVGLGGKESIREYLKSTPCNIYTRAEEYLEL